MRAVSLTLGGCCTCCLLIQYVLFVLVGVLAGCDVYFGSAWLQFHGELCCCAHAVPPACGVCSLCANGIGAKGAAVIAEALKGDGTLQHLR